MSSSTPASEAQVLHGNRAHQLIIVTVIAVLLPTVFLSLRLLARHVLRIRLFFDDWLIIIAWVSPNLSDSAQPNNTEIAVLQDRS